MYQLPKLRLALGLGDQELEQRLRPALDAADDVVVVAQSLVVERDPVQAGQPALAHGVRNQEHHWQPGLVELLQHRLIQCDAGSRRPP